MGLNETLSAVPTNDENYTTFRYTTEDFIAAYRLHSVRLYRNILIFVLAAIACFLVLDYLRGETPLGTFLDLIGSIVCVGPVLAAYHVLLPWWTRRDFARQPLNKLEYRIALRPEGLAIDSERGHTLLLWKDFIRWRKNDKTTLIYLSPRLFQNFPSRLVGLGFPVDELRTALAREVGAPARW